MTLHEAMHAFTGFWLGDDTAQKLGRLTLDPRAHIDPIMTIVVPIFSFLTTGIPFGAAKPVPFNPYRVRYGEFGAALVGLSGPLTNLVLAIIAGLWARFVFDGAIEDVLVLFMFVNLAFFVFNMIPWPPLDGSRLLYAFAPEPVQAIMKQIESLGFMGIAIFIFFAYATIAPLVGSAVIAIGEFILGGQLVI